MIKNFFQNIQIHDHSLVKFHGRQFIKNAKVHIFLVSFSLLSFPLSPSKSSGISLYMSKKPPNKQAGFGSFDQSIFDADAWSDVILGRVIFFSFLYFDLKTNAREGERYYELNIILKGLLKLQSNFYKRFEVRAIPSNISKNICIYTRCEVHDKAVAKGGGG